jgi:hypothetical protein
MSSTFTMSNDGMAASTWESDLVAGKQFSHALEAEWCVTERLESPAPTSSLPDASGQVRLDHPDGLKRCTATGARHELDCSAKQLALVPARRQRSFQAHAALVAGESAKRSQLVHMSALSPRNALSLRKISRRARFGTTFGRPMLSRRLPPRRFTAAAGA